MSQTGDGRFPARTFFADPVEFAAAHRQPLVRLKAMTGDAAVVQDPAEAWRILVTDSARFRQGKWKRRARRFLGTTLNTLDGAEHRERRLLLQPALGRKRIADGAPQLAARAEAFARGLRDGEEIRLRGSLDPLSLTMAGDVLLGVDLEPHARELASCLATVMTHLPRLTAPLPGTAQARALRRVHAVARGLLRGAAGEDGTLLGVLQSSGLPEQVCIGEITAFLLAAADEPPSGLAAAFYFLGADPASERRLQSELAATGNGEPRYLDAVVAEALRMLPPARHVDRCPAHDDVVCGARVRAGTNLLISPLVLQHDPGVFDDPERFRPERWLEVTAPAVPRGAYLPFGAGPHTCIGEPLARSVMTTTLAAVVRRLRLRPAGHQQPPVPGVPDLRFVVESR